MIVRCRLRVAALAAAGADHGVWEANLSADDPFTSSPTETWAYAKAYGRLPDGSSFWVDAPSDTVWWNDTVGFDSGADGTRGGVKFYKARYWTTSFL